MIGMHFTEDNQAVPIKVDWIRLWDNGVTWKHIHTADGVYDWSRLDYMVDNLYLGKEFVYCFSATPQWLARDPNTTNAAAWLGAGSNSLPAVADFPKWTAFVTALATRYLGKINTYQIWNEPQSTLFLYPWDATTRADLASMTTLAYNAIKAVDPTATVLAGPVLPRESSGGMTRGVKYWEAMQAEGWPADAISCHIFPEVGTGPTQWNTYLQDVENAMATYSAPTATTWITETTYNLLGDIIDGSTAYTYVNDTLTYADTRPLFWYAWNRTSDLGGLNINYGTQAYYAMSTFGQDPPPASGGKLYYGTTQISV